MARRRRHHIPWLTLIVFSLLERWMSRRWTHYPPAMRRRNSLARFLILERLGYYSPWLIGLRFVTGLFRRRDDDDTIV